MNDVRPVCGKCFQRMVCIQSGETIAYSEVAQQDGDRYRCPICKYEIIVGFGEPYIEDKTDIENLSERDKECMDED